MAPECVKVAQFSDPFCSRFWSSTSASAFFWSSEAVLDGLGIPKTLTNMCFSRFLQMQVVGTLKLLMVLLGPSWLLLGGSGPKMAPKMDPQMAPNRLKMDRNGELGPQEFQARGLKTIC